MSELPRWIERPSTEMRAVRWSRPDGHALPDGSPRGDDATIDEATFLAEREARVAAENEAALVRADLEVARAQAEESLRALGEACARESDAKAALAKIADETEARVRELVDCAEHQIVRLALAVAERVVGRELTVDPSLVVSWAREAIEGAELGEAVAIYVSTDIDASVAREAWGELAERVVVDPELPRATCELHDGARVVPCSEHSRLALVAASVSDGSDREAA
ncbi:MAG: hypothetical protein JST00_05375 [Deltaproteobacteria bacterium]|nr:hypothetical protein [Deltaproteobacteria bacterium]